MKRMLVPLDGSTLAEAILPAAAALARDHEAEILLIRALPSQGSPDKEVRAQEEAEAYLARIADELRRRGVTRVDRKVWYHDPAVAIADAARHNDADLVAMATHGRGGMSRLLFGSVAEGVVRQGRVPVLLVRGEPRWEAGGIGRILVPLDGSPLSEAVLPAVEGLAGPFDLAVVLLRVIEPLPSAAAVDLQSPEAEALFTVAVTESERYLAKTAETMEARGLRVRTLTRLGPVVDVIQRVSGEEEAGLIAMTTHGRSGLGRLLLGSVAERVLRTASLPVLLWKAPAPA
jgi:nucleotide-binding universal stress UspA family protein